jgi:hypothetical protein
VVPSYLNPVGWLALADGLPRLPALVLAIVAVSMLALGMRGFKFYVRLLFAAAGWVGGTFLAEMMVVTHWYVALPAALIVLGIVWRIAGVLAPLVIGFVAGCGVGTLVVNGFEIDVFWVGFAGGLVAGATLAVMASRFITALFCAGAASLAIISVLGAVARASSGWLSPGAYRQNPVVFVILGAVLFVASMITQVALEPEPTAEEH